MIHDRTCPECGKRFAPTDGRQVCCSDKCKKRRYKRLDHERDRRAEYSRSKNKKRKATEREARQICRARRDLQWNALHTPVTVIRLGGMRIERRGTVPAGGRAVGVVSHNA